MSKKPVIGMTPQYNAENHRVWMRYQYPEALRKSGAISHLLFHYSDPADIAEQLDGLDGVLFTGGNDVNPHRYGEEILPECGEYNDFHDDYEIALCQECLRRGIPIMGICRGIQLMNVAAGGTLWQHKPAHQGVTHDVRILPGTLLHQLIGKDKIWTNSYHHQAVKDPAPIYKIAAYSDVPESGTLIEAIYAPDAPYFNVGVQFHPENMYDDSEDVRKIFDAFVQACAKYRNDR